MSATAPTGNVGLVADRLCAYVTIDLTKQRGNYENAIEWDAIDARELQDAH